MYRFLAFVLFMIVVPPMGCRAFQQASEVSQPTMMATSSEYVEPETVYPTIIPSQTHTATPTVTATETVTLSPIPTDTPTTVPTITPTLPPVAGIPVNPETAHEYCDDRMSVFIVTNDAEPSTPSQWQCWHQEFPESGVIRNSETEYFAMTEPAWSFLELYFEYIKQGDYGEPSEIELLIPFQFSATAYTFGLYCDDGCALEVWYDEAQYPEWIDTVTLSEGNTTRIHQMPRFADGYVLLRHNDVSGGSTVHISITKNG